MHKDRGLDDEDREEAPARSGRLRVPRLVRNQLIQAARSFRQRQTKSEQLLWQELRRGRMSGHVFRRQHPIGPFIADFCCPARSLIVEIDGPIHASQSEADSERQRYLEALGYGVIRVTAIDVETQLSAVLHTIRRCLESLDSTR